MRITHIGLIVILSMAILGLGPSVTSAQTAPIGKNGDVEFTTPVRVGPTTLKPGHYRFQHQIAEGRHYLVIRAQQTASLRGGQHYAGATGAEVARVACALVPTDRQKLTATEVHMRKGGDGMFLLTQIRIAGERDGHMVVLEPQVTGRDAPR